jgi:hypothetical protein
MQYLNIQQEIDGAKNRFLSNLRFIQANLYGVHKVIKAQEPKFKSMVRNILIVIFQLKITVDKSSGNLIFFKFGEANFFAWEALMYRASCPHK